ncbi:hypothetical protein GS501_02535 [Saccharibacter sp. 17.LH.SD]|uniref:hypothetical protein n=1 Tax=Saccharibacter sp. 17.LH.SD TaxID=2689393 RepID=UPI0013710EE7|nr:hypothetical protein [Saccharibacter sp. 17.LH.SD]MXV43930.1 hypothetical protein [Saccharibacter sp. 17.LH.SD]
MERTVALEAYDPKRKEGPYPVEVTFHFGRKTIKVGKKGHPKLIVDVVIETKVDDRKVQYPLATDDEGRVSVMKGQKTLYLTDESASKWESFCDEMQDIAAEEQMRLDEEAE